MSLSYSSPRGDTIPHRGAVVGFGVLLISIAVFPAFFHDLWNPDEPRVAHIAQSMAHSGDWVVQRVNGAPWAEQPPLHAWLLASFFTLFGSGFGKDWVARIPTMLFGIAMIVLVYRLGMRYWGRRVGFLAAVLLATTGEFFVGYQRAIVDTSLAFFVTLALAQLLEVAWRDDEPLPWWRAIVLGAVAGLSFLSKNLIGVTFIGLVFCGAAACAPRCFFRRATVFRLSVAALVAISVVAPWMIALIARDPGSLHELLVENTIGRFQRQDIHNPPRLEFLHRAAAVLLPWLPLAIWELARNARAFITRSKETDNGRVRVGMVVLSWAILPAALVLASGSKREIYLLPVTPAVALAASVWLARHLDNRVVNLTAGGLVAVISVALPLLALFGGFWANTVPWPVWVYLVVALALVYRLVRHRRSRRPGDLTWVALSLLLCALGAGSLVFFKARNGRESYVRLCEDLRALRGSGFRLVGVSLPLRDASAIPYYLDGPIEHQDPSDKLRELLQPDHPPVALVFRASIKSEVLQGTEYFNIGDYRVRRVLRVVSNRLPQKK